ncbi:helix-turn-helix transcriptional regulator [Paenibacillus humicus]|uniref:helix-turn-helix transcriptional regulator n=1 Tax=Paenibacillus humicus TaxID=412861 RepID=UPI003F1833B2
MAAQKTKAPRANRDVLRKLREEKGSRDFVSEELGISNVYLRMIETGKLKPGRDLMLKFAKYFAKPLEVLFPDMFDDQAI